jgi:hypothetical protein
VFELVITVDHPVAQPTPVRQMLNQRIEIMPARRRRCLDQHRGGLREGACIELRLIE